MAICCCSLAGTAACKYCNNNPDAEPSPYKTIVTTSTAVINAENRMPWEDFHPEKLYFFDEQWAPINVSCPECGEQIQRREDIILTSYPPKRQYRCPVCGWEGVK